MYWRQDGGGGISPGVFYLFIGGKGGLLGWLVSGRNTGDGRREDDGKMTGSRDYRVIAKKDRVGSSIEPSRHSPCFCPCLQLIGVQSWEQAAIYRAFKETDRPAPLASGFREFSPTFYA